MPGYLALSEGWWEPGGVNKLYFVLSNLDHAFCFMPGNYDYAIFEKDKWTMIAATWDAGPPAYVRLFVDGDKVCDRPVDIGNARRTIGRIQVGSDQAATDRRQRRSDFSINRLRLEEGALSDLQVHDEYRFGGGESFAQVAAGASAATCGRPPAARIANHV